MEFRVTQRIFHDEGGDLKAKGCPGSARVVVSNIEPLSRAVRDGIMITR
jgi:hypothetical protein